MHESKFKLLISGVMIIAIMGIGVTSYFMLNSQKDDETRITSYSDKELDEKLTEKGFDMAEIDNMDASQKERVALGDKYNEIMSQTKIYSVNKKAVEYPEEKSRALYEALIKYLEVNDYQSIIGEVDEVLNNFNLSKGENSKIAALYADAVRMNQYDSLNKDNKESILKAHRDPVALAIDALSVYPRRREAVILDTASKTPVFDGDIKFKSISEMQESDKDFKYYKDLWKDTKIITIYKIILSIPEVDDLECIVLKSYDDELRIAGYYGDKENRYITVAERAALGVDEE